VVMVILVLSIVAGLTAPIFSQGLAATHSTKENLQTIEKLRYASERLAREIRQVNYNGAGYDISSMTGTSLTFTKNDGSSTTVTINFSGSAVTLGYSSPALSATLTDEVSSLAFAYYDSSNAATASATNVAFIEYTLTLQNSVTGGSYSQRTRVALRER
jgi:MSHA biogenesis protein MshO